MKHSVLKKKYVVGNWKANKNSRQVEDWFQAFAKLYKKHKGERLDNLEIVLCPPFIFLQLARDLKKSLNLPIKLGAQNVSPFEEGPFTGEISAGQIAEFAKYVIIGHSERRANFHEDDSQLAKKVSITKKNNLVPIFCVQGKDVFIPSGVSICAYEPVWAIGTGKFETPESANKIAKKIKQKNDIEVVLYGGSVNSENVSGFIETSHIDGVLPGGASLYPETFWQIIINAISI